MTYKITFCGLGRKRATDTVYTKDLSQETLQKIFRPFYIEDIKITVNRKERKGTISLGIIEQSFSFTYMRDKK